MRVTSSFVASVAVAASCGCATFRHGPTQQLSIATEPAGASCEVTREGMPVGRIDATPGNIELARGAARLQFACVLSEYLEERDTIEILDHGDLQRYANAVRDRERYRVRQEEWARSSDTQNAARVASQTAAVLGVLALAHVVPIVGPFLPMGVYGPGPDAAFVADAATGVIHGFSLAPVRLVPERFADEAAREAFFDERRRQVEALAALARDVVNELYCVPVALAFRCDPRREQVEATLRRRLDALARQHAQTHIVTP